MRMVKTVFVVCVAVSVMGAVATTTASAVTPGWMVNGNMLEGSKALATTAAVDESTVLSGGGFSLRCSGAILSGVAPEIISPSMGSATSLILHECVSTTTDCELSASDKEIHTVPLLSEVTLEGVLGVRGMFSPKTGSTLATIKFEGEKCSGAGTKGITGSVVASAPTGQDERTSQLHTVNTEATESTLKFASGAAKLTGKALLKLASGEPWSYLPAPSTSTTASTVTPGWMVNGKMLEGSKALATTASVDGVMMLSGGGFSLKCTGAILKGVAPEIIPSSMGSATSLIFTTCVSTTAHCELSAADEAELGTVPLLSEVTLEGALGARGVFAPKTSTILITLKFEGESCSGSGVKAATGKVIASAPTDQDERTLQLHSINTTASESTLKFASGAATLTGSVLLKLATGEPWSYL